MKKILFTGIILAMFPFVSFAQTAVTGTVTTTTSPTPTSVAPVVPGFLPGDFFYFLDRWGEALNIFLTFNKEGKARLNLEYAKERAKEIKEVLKDSRRKIADIEDAKNNYYEHISDAAVTIKEEKDKGNDVSKLARELDDELDVSHDEFKGALNDHEDKASIAEIEIRAKIASLSAGDPQIPGLTQALESIIKEKQDSMNEDADLENKVSDGRSAFDEAMGPKMAAEKYMERVLRLREFMMKKNREEGFQGNYSASSEQLIKQAQKAMMRGDFESAMDMSEQAKSMFENRQERDNSETPDIREVKSTNGLDEYPN